MNTKDKGEPNDQPIVIEDLPVDETRQDEVKGAGTGAAGYGVLQSTAGVNTWTI